MRLPKPILLLLLLQFVATKAFLQGKADSLYVIDPRIQLHDLKSYSSILVDSTNELDASVITSGKLDHYFQSLVNFKKDVPANTTYWLKISLGANAPINNWWLLLRDTGNFSGYTSQLAYVDVFYKKAGDGLQHERTGAFVPRSQKNLKKEAGFNAVLFSANANEVQTVYIKIKNEFGSGKELLPYPVIHNPVIPVGGTGFGDLITVLCTIALLFTVISLFFFFFVRERAYLFFAVYTFFISQHYLILHYNLPFVDLYIPENPILAVPAFTFLAMGGFIFFFLFGRLFINLKSIAPKTDKLLKWFLLLWVVVALTEVVLEITLRRYVLNPYMGFLLMPISIAFIIRFGFLKTALARIYVAGAVWLVSFTVMGILMNSGVNIGFNPWPIGQVGQLLIFAMGLAYKVRLNEKARAESERIKEMDNIKSKFFANISHEFRTPLTLIQGPLQQIEEEAGKKEGTVPVPMRHIKTMRRHTNRLLELVNQLLDLSKLDSGKMNLQIIKGDVLQLLKVLTGSFESMAERKGIHYHVHFPEGTEIGFFDKDKLEKIVSNLLTNAFKYTPEQGTVSVDAAIEENRLRFTVEDNGPGISKKELDKIFDRFYQVEGTEDKGSGIGLALVKELVDLYRGQISVSSEPGKGCRFKITLPVEKAAFKEHELVYGEWKAEELFINKNIEESIEKTTVKEIANSQLPLLLIVEDNNDLRNFIKETVEQHYQIIEAANGKEGLEKAIAEVPDIIVSDVMMPLMDGFTMTGKIKKDERTSHIPVILLTAKAGTQQKIEGLETGADDYLTKPFDAKELLTRLNNLISQRKLLRKKFAGEILLKPSKVAVTSADNIFLNKVMTAIEENMSEEDFGVEELAKEVAMSRSQLHRKLVALTGQSPSEVLRNTRLLRAKELLHKKAATPGEVAFKVGFNSHTYFSKCFKEEFGISPSEV